LAPRPFIENDGFVIMVAKLKGLTQFTPYIHENQIVLQQMAVGGHWNPRNTEN
jgi:hypothetical protein